METRTIIAADSRAALDRVMDLLGPDAVIIETRKTRNGVEVLAGIERPDFGGVTSIPTFRGRQEAPRAALPKTDPMVRFIAQARAVGVDPELLADELALGGDDLADVWSHFMMRLERDLRLAPLPYRELSHLCVVGDSGSAKTTSLAQIAAFAKAAQPGEPMAFLAGDRRLGAREQLRVIAAMLDLPMLEPGPRETLSDAAARLGGSRRLFIDMPSDPRLAACEADELRARLGRDDMITTLCTLPLNGQLARHRQIASLFTFDFNGYMLTHAGEALPPGAAVHMLLEGRVPLAGIGRSESFADGLDLARGTSLCRMVVAALSGCGSAVLQ